MSSLTTYYKNDLYLIIFYIITVIFSTQWQEYAPYISRQREMSVVEDLFICALFAFSSLLITLVGLSNLKSESNEETIYIGKILLGCIYGTLCTIAMVYIADTSFLRHEFILRIIITTILFYTAVYFSILYKVKFKNRKSILIIFLASIPFLYFFTQ